MRSTKRVPWIILALVALAAGIIALVQRQRATAGQVTTERVTTGKTTQYGYRQKPLWHIYDQIAETLDHTVGWDKVPTPLGLLIMIGLRTMQRQQALNDIADAPATLTHTI